jgi:hypothetical protein
MQGTSFNLLLDMQGTLNVQNDGVGRADLI